MNRGKPGGFFPLSFSVSVPGRVAEMQEDFCFSFCFLFSVSRRDAERQEGGGQLPSVLIRRSFTFAGRQTI